MAAVSRIAKPGAATISGHQRAAVVVALQTLGNVKRFQSTSSAASSEQSMTLEGFAPEVGVQIAKAATQAQTSVSLQDLMRTGRGEYLHKTFQNPDSLQEKHTATELVLIQVASFLRRELPVRLAHRIQDLEQVPLMKDTKSVREVRDLYIQSFLEIESFDASIRTPDQEEEFSKLIENIYERHGKVLVQMARGAYEYRDLVRQEELEFELMEETHNFLDRFYLYRIGIRVLIGQYLALRQPPVENYVGIVCSHTSPYEIVKRAIDDAAFMCTRKYGDAPEVIMSGRLDLTFPYVPTHLRKFASLLACFRKKNCSQSINCQHALTPILFLLLYA
jgi:pyruvate dehydrogenase kinase 2/3/4